MGLTAMNKLLLLGLCLAITALASESLPNGKDVSVHSSRVARDADPKQKGNNKKKMKNEKRQAERKKERKAAKKATKQVKRLGKKDDGSKQKGNKNKDIKKKKAERKEAKGKRRKQISLTGKRQ